MERQVLTDLDRTLGDLRARLESERQELARRRQELARKERQLQLKLKVVRQELADADQEAPRLERRGLKLELLAIREALGKVRADLEDPGRGAWGDILPILASFVVGDRGRTALRLVVPVDPGVVEAWEARAETPPLRAALIGYATLVKLAVEHDVCPVPEPGEWDGFLTLRLELGALTPESREEARTMDAALFLEEATPTPWAGGGREMVPRLVWVPPEVLDPGGEAS